MVFDGDACQHAVNPRCRSHMFASLSCCGRTEWGLYAPCPSIPPACLQPVCVNTRACTHTYIYALACARIGNGLCTHAHMFATFNSRSRPICVHRPTLSDRRQPVGWTCYRTWLAQCQWRTHFGCSYSAMCWRTSLCELPLLFRLNPSLFRFVCRPTAMM